MQELFRAHPKALQRKLSCFDIDFYFTDDWGHCHLQKGNPTYVCCWKVFEDTQTIEVYYVGTHENAPY